MHESHFMYIRQYSTEPSHRSVQFNCITPNLLATVFSMAWYKIVTLSRVYQKTQVTCEIFQGYNIRKGCMASIYVYFFDCFSESGQHDGRIHVVLMTD